MSLAGAIDWLCWPRFDSPSVFASLLDDAAGHWTVAPTTPFRAQRRYLVDTNVLETSFVTTSGSFTLTDFMPVASEEERRRLLAPDHEILRLVVCERGEVEVETVFAPRPDYGRERPRLRDAGRLGLRAETRAGLLTLRADLPLAIDEWSTATQGGLAERDCEELHRALIEAQRPIVVTAYLGRQPDAVRKLVAVSERYGIGVCEVSPQYVNFPGEHPHHLSYRRNALIDEADLILMLDVDVPWINGKVQPAQGARLFHIDVDPVKPGLGYWHFAAQRSYQGHPELAVSAYGKEGSVEARANRRFGLYDCRSHYRIVIASDRLAAMTSNPIPHILRLTVWKVIVPLS